MRLAIPGLLLALVCAGCSSPKTASPSFTSDSGAGTLEAGSAANDGAATADAGSVSCSEAPSLESFCCSSANILYAACPRDFASFAAICGVNPGARISLSATPCAGFVFANASGVDTGFIFAFDATTGALRAVLYGGASYTCSGASDPTVAIPSACVSSEFPHQDLCNAGNEPTDGGFVTFCSTTVEGDPACPTYYNGECPYPTSCVGEKCQYVDGGADAG